MARISIDNGFPGDGSLKFYVSPRDLGEELERELHEAGVEAEPIIEFSDTAQAVAVLAVGFLGSGGVKQLASLLEVFFHRHDGKEFTLRDGEKEISSKGLSAKQIEPILEGRVGKQRTIDDEWRRFTEGDPTTDS